MSIAISKQCPHCDKPFPARRKNQLYCSTECRTDANNVVAKGRYALFKQEAPKVNTFKNQINQLKQYIASLTIVIEDMEVIDSDTIGFRGRKYKRGNRVGQPNLLISLNDGGAILVPGNKIIYRSVRPNQASLERNTYQNCWEYNLVP